MVKVVEEPGFFHFSSKHVRACKGRHAHRDVIGYMRQNRERNLRTRTRVKDPVTYMLRQHELADAQRDVLHHAFYDQGCGLTSDEFWLANDRANRCEDGEYKRHGGHFPRLGFFITASFPFGVSLPDAIAALDRFARHLGETYGLACEVVIHAKAGAPDHAHLFVSDRMVGENGVGVKNRSLNGMNAKITGNSVRVGADCIIAAPMEDMRATWATLTRGIAPAGAIIDHRSFRRRGLKIKPVGYVPRGTVREQEAQGLDLWRLDRAEALAKRRSVYRDVPSRRTGDPRRAVWSMRQNIDTGDASLRRRSRSKHEVALASMAYAARRKLDELRLEPEPPPDTVAKQGPTPEPALTTLTASATQHFLEVGASRPHIEHPAQTASSASPGQAPVEPEILDNKMPTFVQPEAVNPSGTPKVPTALWSRLAQPGRIRKPKSHSQKELSIATMAYAARLKVDGRPNAIPTSTMMRDAADTSKEITVKDRCAGPTKTSERSRRVLVAISLALDGLRSSAAMALLTRVMRDLADGTKKSIQKRRTIDLGPYRAAAGRRRKQGESEHDLLLTLALKALALKPVATPMPARDHNPCAGESAPGGKVCTSDLNDTGNSESAHVEAAAVDLIPTGTTVGVSPEVSIRRPDGNGTTAVEVPDGKIIERDNIEPTPWAILAQQVDLQTLPSPADGLAPADVTTLGLQAASPAPVDEAALPHFNSPERLKVTMTGGSEAFKSSKEPAALNLRRIELEAGGRSARYKPALLIFKALDEGRMVAIRPESADKGAIALSAGYQDELDALQVRSQIEGAPTLEDRNSREGMPYALARSQDVYEEGKANLSQGDWMPSGRTARTPSAQKDPHPSRSITSNGISPVTSHPDGERVLDEGSPGVLLDGRSIRAVPVSGQPYTASARTQQADILSETVKLVPDQTTSMVNKRSTEPQSHISAETNGNERSFDSSAPQSDAQSRSLPRPDNPQDYTPARRAVVTNIDATGKSLSAHSSPRTHSDAKPSDHKEIESEGREETQTAAWEIGPDKSGEIANADARTIGREATVHTQLALLTHNPTKLPSDRLSLLLGYAAALQNSGQMSKPILAALALFDSRIDHAGIRQAHIERFEMPGVLYTRHLPMTSPRLKEAMRKIATTSNDIDLLAFFDNLDDLVRQARRDSRAKRSGRMSAKSTRGVDPTD